MFPLRRFYYSAPSKPLTVTAQPKDNTVASTLTKLKLTNADRPAELEGKATLHIHDTKLTDKQKDAIKQLAQWLGQAWITIELPPLPPQEKE